MSESGFVNEAPGAGPSRGPGTTGAGRRRRWLLPAVLVFAMVVLPAFAGWAYLGRLHADDVSAYEELAQQFVLVDRQVGPLSHGNSPPCESSHEGTLTRSYSRQGGPTVLDLRAALVQLGWTQVLATPPARIELGLPSQTPGHQLIVLLEAPSTTSFGVSLTATSSASALACLVRG